ncbi:hypothetical protein EVAR_86784_1 [Eumeta japonica]|uniref:Uncharacterized protein n=1 Tax=Eumeta variegata TaxID=151549 RepID=A0A4C1W134_EUMVA|nr:hypothetical protein EVAR_86784_1 [Eumeta japonica]
MSRMQRPRARRPSAVSQTSPLGAVVARNLRVNFQWFAGAFRVVCEFLSPPAAPRLPTLARRSSRPACTAIWLRDDNINNAFVPFDIQSGQHNALLCDTNLKRLMCCAQAKIRFGYFNRMIGPLREGGGAARAIGADVIRALCGAASITPFVRVALPPRDWRFRTRPIAKIHQTGGPGIVILKKKTTARSIARGRRCPGRGSSADVQRPRLTAAVAGAVPAIAHFEKCSSRTPSPAPRTMERLIRRLGSDESGD